MRTTPLMSAMLMLLLYSCETDNDQFLIASQDNESASSEVEFRSSNDFEVYFAQTHVLRPGDDYFELVSSRPALLKAQVTDPHGGPAPEIAATLTSAHGEEMTLTLSGPTNLPTSFDADPCNVVHTFDDSYTAVIPADWVQPGLQVQIAAGSQNAIFNDLNIGAPNKIVMNMFDFHFFNSAPENYPEGWQEELAVKWPVSELEVRRIPDIVFTELTIPPRGGCRPARISSPAEYRDLTGKNFDGEQDAALRWKSALRDAAGHKGRHTMFYGNIYGVAAGGEGGNFGGVGKGGQVGILHHELGHAFSLRHWSNFAGYPYRGSMCGTQPPNVHRKIHVGPTWAFDLGKNDFISPYIERNTHKGAIGAFKTDPMNGGGFGTQDPGYLLNHFSDYSVHQIRDYLSWHMVVWNGSNFANWNAADGAYSNNVTSTNEVDYPMERDVEVISVMAGYSSTTEQANIVYPPIGPYTSGRIRLFEPEIPDDRIRANQIYCPPRNGCDVSVRVEQGGNTKTYMLPIGHREGERETNYWAFNTKAINLRAEDGPVTKIELLSTPNVEDNGLPANPAILYTWEQ